MPATVPAPRDVDDLCALVNRGGRVKYLFFWGHRPRRDGAVGTATDPRAADPTRWRGRNLLGFALMRAREILAGTG